MPTPALKQVWRIYAYNSNGGGYIEASEFILATSFLGTTATGSGTASASSNYGANYPALACDNNNATQWISAGTAGNEWWEYDFGTPTEITCLGIVPYNLNRAPYNFDVQYSDGAGGWITKRSFTNQSYRATNTTQWFNLAPVTKGKWRVFVNDSQAATYIEIAEISMAESVGGSDLTSVSGCILNESSHYASQYPDYAFDDNNATYWLSGYAAGNEYVEIDFGVAKNITEIKVTCSTTTNRAPKNLKFLYWNEESGTWITAYIAPTQPAWSSNEQRTFSFTLTNNAAFFLFF